MRARSLVVGACLALGLVLTGATGATTASLPGGTSISTTISFPANGATLPQAPVHVQGNASVGQGAAVANTLLMYVIDVSGSTLSPQPTSACGYQNVYDQTPNTTLDCELATIKAVNNEAISDGTVGQIGVIGFGGAFPPGSLADAQIIDLSGAVGDQHLIAPSSNVSPSPFPIPAFVAAPHNDLERAVQSAYVDESGFVQPPGWPSPVNTSGFGLYTNRGFNANTNYWAAVEAIKTLAAQSSLPNKLAIFLSDGISNVGGPAGQHVEQALTDLSGSGVKIDTFAVGPDSACTTTQANYGTLETIATTTGGPSNHCVLLPNPADAVNSVPDAIASKLTKVSTSVDGGALTAASTASTLPVTGPGDTNFSQTLSGLAPGPHHLCAQADGTDGGGSGSVQDCVDFTIEAPPTVTLVGGDDPATGVAGSVPEGSPFSVGASVSDGTISWTSSGGTGHCTFADPNAGTTSVSCDDDGLYALTISVNDGVNPAVTATEHLLVTNVNPSPTLTVSPTTVPLGPPVVADVTIADPGTNDTFTCVFDFGEGPPTPPIPASGNACHSAHSYATGGVRHVTVTVTDDDGGVGTDAQDVTVKGLPEITLGGGGDGPNGYAGEVPEGSPFALNTSVDGATSTTWSATGGTGTCTFADPSSAATQVTCDDNGLYALTITAVDQYGQVASATEHLLVDNVAPTVTGHDDLGPNPQNAVVEMHWTIADPGNDTFTCSIDWGDGTTASGVVSGNDCSGHHFYGAGGTFHPIATVTDDDGGIGSGGATVVLDQAPTVTVTDSSGAEGAIVFIAGVVSDDHGATAHWSVLPGADVDPGATCTFGDAFSPITTVSCTDDGHYTLTMTANDGVNPPVVAFGTLTLTNVAPTLALTSSVSGLTVTVTGAVTDQGTNDTQICSFNWNDGATTSAGVTGGTCSSSHTYAAGPASRTIDVMATDDDGGSTSKSVTVTINRPPVCTGASASPDSLWPPNHQWVAVTIRGCTDADGDPIAIHVDSVTQDEPLNGTGDGDTAPDARRDAGGGISLRAERKGNGDGRVYTIAFTASDGRGGTTTGTVTVGVPHSAGGAAVKTPGVSVNSFG